LAELKTNPLSIMKNIFVALALFFALGASAQVKKAPVKQASASKAPAKELTTLEAGQKDFDALNAFVTVEESSKANLVKLFESKHRDLRSSATLSEERKTVLSSYIAARLEEFLGAEKFAKVKGNAALFSKLTK